MSVSRRAFLGAGAAVAGAAALGAMDPMAAWAATYVGYAMAYFTESPSTTGANYGLHLAVSPDGLNWTPLNQNSPVVTPTAARWVCVTRSSCASRTARSRSWPPTSTAPTSG
jgi:secreted PhoX family phosphatase